MNAPKTRTLATLIHAAQVAKRQLDVATELCDERVEAVVVTSEAIKAAIKTHARGKVLVTPTEDGKGWIAYHVTPTGHMEVHPALFANEVPFAPPSQAPKTPDGRDCKACGIPGCQCNAAVDAFAREAMAHAYCFGGHAPLNGNGHPSA